MDISTKLGPKAVCRSYVGNSCIPCVNSQAILAGKKKQDSVTKCLGLVEQVTCLDTVIAPSVSSGLREAPWPCWFGAYSQRFVETPWGWQAHRSEHGRSQCERVLLGETIASNIEQQYCSMLDDILQREIGSKMCGACSCKAHKV